MSEPIRKPKQIPESYGPKNKPEILNIKEVIVDDRNSRSSKFGKTD